MSRPAIRVSNLAKSYAAGRGEGAPVLRGLDLSIAEGEFVCLLGPSGCGKSTFLNILAGLDRDYTGRIEMGEGRIGYLFQEPRLLPWLSAERNIDFALQSCRVPRERWAELKDHYLALTGLTAFRSYYPHQMSGGMCQRLALVRALSVEPSVLLMDEPFSGLDELTARKMRVDLLAVWRATGKTIVFVTHNAFEAAFLADRILVMSKGAVRQEIAVPVKRPRDYDDPELFHLSREVVRVFLEEAGEAEKPAAPSPSGIAPAFVPTA